MIPYTVASPNPVPFPISLVEGFMVWAADHAKDGAAVLIVDVLQRINNQVFDRTQPMATLEKAFRKADEVKDLCARALKSLEPAKQSRIKVLEWPDILMAITSRNLGEIVSRLGEDQIAQLSEYILFELPELITGFIFGGVHYNLNTYPGNISAVYSELMEHDFFKEMLPRFAIIGKYACIEAYF